MNIFYGVIFMWSVIGKSVFKYMVSLCILYNFKFMIFYLSPFAKFKDLKIILLIY